MPFLPFGFQEKFSNGYFNMEVKSNFKNVSLLSVVLHRLFFGYAYITTHAFYNYAKTSKERILHIDKKGYLILLCQITNGALYAPLH